MNRKDIVDVLYIIFLVLTFPISMPVLLVQALVKYLHKPD